MSIQREFIVVNTGVVATYANLTSNVYVGNTSVYNYINSTAIVATGGTLTVSGNTAFTNNVTIAGNLSVQSSVFSVNSTTFNITGITTLAGNTTINADLTVNGNTTLGDAATDSVTIKANTVSIQSNASFNSGLLYIDTLNSRVGVGTNAPGSKLGVVGDIGATGNVVVTGSVFSTVGVNTAVFSVGALFTANSTLVNTAAINVTGQVNTATLFATTSANVGANVQVTTTGYTVSNTTSNVTINAATITIGNTDQSATINSTSFTGNANSATYLAGAGATTFVSNSALQTYGYLSNAAAITTFTSNASLQGYGYLSNAAAITTFASNASIQGYGYLSNAAAVTTFVSNSALQGYGYSNASNLATGTVPTARLATGTANSTTYLRGDQTWATITANRSANVAGVLANSTHYYINSSNGIVANSTGLFLNAGTGVTINTTGISIAQAVGTASNVQHGSLGIGTAASGTSGEIRATNNITAYYSSDERLKENVTPITNALSKLYQISGVEFDWTDEFIESAGGVDGYFVRRHDVGVIAQELQKILPEAVAEREDGILAVKYERIVPLLIQAIKELEAKVNDLEEKTK